ncbi:nuclear transport factor 2 family protein [Tabrizicola sp. J26]|nr:nuclear transport factor 2 family protein [Tabrizicola rongguiensis]
MAEDCAFHASAGKEVEGAIHRGRAAVRAAYIAIFETFVEAAWSEGKNVVAGETGLSNWRFVGKTREGHTVDVRGCDIFHFDGDLIALKDSYRKARV